MRNGPGGGRWEVDVRPKDVQAEGLESEGWREVRVGRMEQKWDF